MKGASHKLEGKVYGSYIRRLHVTWKWDMANEEGAWIDNGEETDANG